MNSLEKYGLLDDEILKNIPGVPSRSVISSKPVAVLECAQEIPCNPCELSCPQGAIKVGKPITNLPIIDSSKCTGCAACVAACPGLAIFVVNQDYSAATGTVTLPYELLPLPEKGQKVVACNREGIPLSHVDVIRVQASKSYDRTTLVTLEIPKELAMDVRGFYLKDPKPVNLQYMKNEMEDSQDDVVICRCQEVTKRDIITAIEEEGCRTVNEIKRATRAGMGLCQGRTCGRMVSRILAEAMGIGLAEVKPATFRVPVRVISLGTIGSSQKDD